MKCSVIDFSVHRKRYLWPLLECICKRLGCGFSAVEIVRIEHSESDLRAHVIFRINGRISDGYFCPALVTENDPNVHSRPWL